jgi:hypothetical protein
VNTAVERKETTDGIALIERPVNLLRGRMELFVRVDRILKFFGGGVSTEPLLEGDFRPNVYPPPLRRDLGGPRLLHLRKRRRQ